MFNQNSGLVQIWVKNIKDKGYAKSDVPNISNLREVVYEILDNQ